MIHPQVRVFPVRRSTKVSFKGPIIEEIEDTNQSVHRLPEPVKQDNNRDYCSQKYIPPIVNMINNGRNILIGKSVKGSTEKSHDLHKNCEYPEAVSTIPERSSRIFNWQTEKILPSEMVLIDNDIQTSKMEWKTSIEKCVYNLSSSRK
jgi:hypothetical protein